MIPNYNITVYSEENFKLNLMVKTQNQTVAQWDGGGDLALFQFQ